MHLARRPMWKRRGSQGERFEDTEARYARHCPLDLPLGGLDAAVAHDLPAHGHRRVCETWIGGE